MPENLRSVVGKFYNEYMDSTPKKLKIVDAYLFYILMTGGIQFIYCCMVGTFPFNSFLSGFTSCVGSFVLGGLYLNIIYTLNAQHSCFIATVALESPWKNFKLI